MSPKITINREPLSDAASDDDLSIANSTAPNDPLPDEAGEDTQVDHEDSNLQEEHQLAPEESVAQIPTGNDLLVSEYEGDHETEKLEQAQYRFVEVESLGSGSEIENLEPTGLPEQDAPHKQDPTDHPSTNTNQPDPELIEKEIGTEKKGNDESNARSQTHSPLSWQEQAEAWDAFRGSMRQENNIDPDEPHHNHDNDKNEAGNKGNGDPRRSPPHVQFQVKSKHRVREKHIEEALDTYPEDEWYSPGYWQWRSMFKPVKSSPNLNKDKHGTGSNLDSARDRRGSKKAPAPAPAPDIEIPDEKDTVPMMRTGGSEEPDKKAHGHSTHSFTNRSSKYPTHYQSAQPLKAAGSNTAAQNPERTSHLIHKVPIRQTHTAKISHSGRGLVDVNNIASAKRFKNRNGKYTLKLTGSDKVSPSEDIYEPQFQWL